VGDGGIVEGGGSKERERGSTGYRKNREWKDGSIIVRKGPRARKKEAMGVVRVKRKGGNRTGN